jgi:protein tyrosine phosphatase (PTP) superfamily phosphohydrolase (DUF442 family)
MKSFITFLIISCLALFSATAQENTHPADSVEVIPEYRNLYRYQNFYLSGQPTYEALQWIKSKGASRIINLRAEKENSEFTASSFNEEIIARQLGYQYWSVPVDGMKDYTPAKLEEFTNLITGNDTILIHCASAGRVTNFFMAYLIRSRGYTVNHAISIGRKLTFSLPLEKLLDEEIVMEIE